MIDITEHSENELSLIVYNDETLYRQRNRSNFLNIIKEMFIYTDKQLEVLKDDIEDEN